jgi:hypothetical protein
MLDKNFRYTPNSTKQAFFDFLGFDFLSRIRFAMLYETPPKMNPVAVAVSVWVTLKASTRIEKVNVAINTLLQKPLSWLSIFVTGSRSALLYNQLVKDWTL